ncbi:MAG: hypothetical protein GF331_17455 [Chitinivibrionales bacterium]|nr:hypothetical protein [Chitinivibrionales bacterium]
MKKPFLLVVVMLSLLAIGCANFAALQTADVMPKGKSEFGMAATLNRYEVVYANDTDSLRHSARMPAVALWYRRGVAKRLDLSVFAWLPLGFRTGLKCQLAGASDRNGFALSLGAEGGYAYIDREGLVFHLLEWHAPLYLGVDISEYFSLYAVPRYIGRCSFGEAGAGVGHAAAGTAGLKLGRRFPLYLEGTYGYEATTGGWFYSGAVGVGIRSR